MSSRFSIHGFSTIAAADPGCCSQVAGVPAKSGVRADPTFVGVLVRGSTETVGSYGHASVVGAAQRRPVDT